MLYAITLTGIMILMASRQLRFNDRVQQCTVLIPLMVTPLTLFQVPLVSFPAIWRVVLPSIDKGDAPQSYGDAGHRNVDVDESGDADLYLG
ncbi:hypothetical protein ACP5PY_24530 [Photobacterium leiognathi subsp. mandapamensis]